MSGSDTVSSTAVFWPRWSNVTSTKSKEERPRHDNVNIVTSLQTFGLRLSYVYIRLIQHVDRRQLLHFSWIQSSASLSLALTLHSLVVSPRNSGFSFTNVIFAQTAYFCVFMDLRKKRLINSLYSSHWLIFITGAERVYCAVWEESLNTISPNVNRDLQRVNDQ